MVTMHGHGHDDHGHGGTRHTPHESPQSMTYVLARWRRAAVLGGLLGYPPTAWTGAAPHPRTWLEPALPAIAHSPIRPRHSTRVACSRRTLVSSSAWRRRRWFSRPMLYKDNRSPSRRNCCERGARLDRCLQQVLRRRALPGDDPARFDGARRARCRGSTESPRWLGEPGRRHHARVRRPGRAIDRYLVDGAVNLVANSTLSAGSILRRVQTGRIQTYLYGALAGGIAIVLLNFIIK